MTSNDFNTDLRGRSPWTRELWTYVIVTLVTVLIWFWAAGETRETKVINNARVQFTVPEPANWVITPPPPQAATLTIEGSTFALQKAEALLRGPLEISVSPTPGRQTIDILERLQRHDLLRETGVTVVSAEPTQVEIELDRIERSTVRIKPSLPGVTTEGEIVIDPPEVIVAMPSQLRQSYPQGVTVEAFVDRAELDRLQPGIPHTLEVKLRIPELIGLVGSNNNVTITPSRAMMTFTIRSRTRETLLESVRVQVAGPPEDRNAYTVEIEPKQLRNVTIIADADLIRRIENNEVPVFAMLHLSSREKEARIESKRVTYFIAMVPEASGTRGVQVEARVDGVAEMPLVRLNITRTGTP